MREMKKRIIYNNYDLYEDLRGDAIDEIKDRNGESYVPDEDEIWEEIYDLDELNWECEKSQLENFFSNGTYILTGTVGRWDGPCAGGFVFQGFDEMWYKHQIAKDCDYIRFYDVNGHFYIDCSHHDGTNHFEVKKLTERGVHMYEQWGGAKSEREAAEALFGNSNYSVLPHYAHKVFGVPKQEWLPKTA